MFVKMEPTQTRESNRGLRKKLFCPMHGSKYIYKCENKICTSPFICHKMECIDQHFHADKLSMTKLNHQNLAKKFADMDKVLAYDAIERSTKELEVYIEGLKDSINLVSGNLKNYKTTVESLKESLEKPLSYDFISQLEEGSLMQRNLSHQLQNIKAKIVYDISSKEDEFFMKQKLIAFLKFNIPGFQWSQCQELINSKTEGMTCEKFHEKLAGRKNLLFLFFGEKGFVGSFYQSAYPLLSEKHMKDPKSFIFLTDENEQIVKFMANAEVEYHLIISQRLLICQGNTPSYADGIRTFQKNFSTIDYCLPSRSYYSIQSNETEFNGSLKVKDFLIMQFVEEE